MEDDSESFDLEFVYEQHNDGPARLVRSIESHPDGRRIVVEYEEVPSLNDPYVRSRQRAAGDAPPREIVTEFLPSPIRPPTFPKGFPFLESRACHTTESPDGSRSPGARWPCSDPDAVLAALVEVAEVDGWTRAPIADVPSMMRGNLAAAFRHGSDLRLFHRADHEQGSVIQMLDIDEDWLDSPYRDETPVKRRGDPA